ncbi:hypothetical protein M569_12299, partial [Genlisea aurea]
GKLMRAVQYDGYGGGAAALKHVEVPIPSPGKDELLIKIEAVSLNPLDWRTQKGIFRPILPRKFPFIPAGTDVAGEVVQIGNGVQNFKPGDQVVAGLNFLTSGGLAEYGVAKENMTVLRPPGLSAAEGAAIPMAGLTALQAVTQSAGLELDEAAPRKNILITAASGGVGHHAVQLAKLGNNHVTATCGARNLGLIRSLGADEVLDYRTPEGASLASPSGKKYDVVIHCAKGIPWSVFEPNLSPNGKVIDLTPGLSSLWNSAVKTVLCSKKRLVPLAVSAKGENLQLLVDLVREGKLKSVIDSKFPLSRAEDGWDKGINGPVTGKIIVEP